MAEWIVDQDQAPLFRLVHTRRRLVLELRGRGIQGEVGYETLQAPVPRGQGLEHVDVQDALVPVVVALLHDLEVVGLDQPDDLRGAELLRGDRGENGLEYCQGGRRLLRSQAGEVDAVPLPDGGDDPRARHGSDALHELEDAVPRNGVHRVHHQASEGHDVLDVTPLGEADPAVHHVGDLAAQELGLDVTVGVQVILQAYLLNDFFPACNHIKNFLHRLPTITLKPLSQSEFFDGCLLKIQHLAGTIS